MKMSENEMKKINKHPEIKSEWSNSFAKKHILYFFGAKIIIIFVKIKIFWHYHEKSPFVRNSFSVVGILDAFLSEK